MMAKYQTKTYKNFVIRETSKLQIGMHRNLLTKYLKGAIIILKILQNTVKKTKLDRENGGKISSGISLIWITNIGSIRRTCGV